VRGELDRLPTQQLSLVLLRKRLSTSPGTERDKAAEVRAFFEKWERIFQPEIAHISAL
jgi:hypothetical protein